MAGTIAHQRRKIVRAFIQRNVSEEFIRTWEKLRDDNDKLTNLRTLWTRAYAEHCSNVYDEEQRVSRIDQAQNTDKHVRGLWATLGIEHKAKRSKIRATGKWFKGLPQHERDKIIAQIPATKEALYAATSHDGATLAGMLKSNSISPESTTAEFRELLGKATPQDRLRNTKLTGAPETQVPKQSRTKTRGPYRVTLTCSTWDAMTELIAYAKSRSDSYSIESAPPVIDV